MELSMGIVEHALSPSKLTQVPRRRLSPIYTATGVTATCWLKEPMASPTAPPTRWRGFPSLLTAPPAPARALCFHNHASQTQKAPGDDLVHPPHCTEGETEAQRDEAIWLRSHCE